VAKEENKAPSVEELQNQIRQLEKLVNHYASKANQLEQQLVLSQDDK
jgi:archaellum component FlaC